MLVKSELFQVAVDFNVNPQKDSAWSQLRIC